MKTGISPLSDRLSIPKMVVWHIKEEEKKNAKPRAQIHLFLSYSLIILSHLGVIYSMHFYTIILDKRKFNY